jgi:hypothetical protein
LVAKRRLHDSVHGVGRSAAPPSSPRSAIPARALERRERPSRGVRLCRTIVAVLLPMKAARILAPCAPFPILASHAAPRLGSGLILGTAAAARGFQSIKRGDWRSCSILDECYRTFRHDRADLTLRTSPASRC